MTTPDATSATSASGSDTYSYVTTPTVTGVTTVADPAGGPTGGGTQVTITGTSFSGVTAVDFGGTPASFEINSLDSITATSPAGTGTVNITVENGFGTSTTSSADDFAYNGTLATAAGTASYSNSPGTAVPVTATSQSGSTVTVTSIGTWTAGQRVGLSGFTNGLTAGTYTVVTGGTGSFTITFSPTLSGSGTGTATVLNTATPTPVTATSQSGSTVTLTLKAGDPAVLAGTWSAGQVVYLTGFTNGLTAGNYTLTGGGLGTFTITFSPTLSGSGTGSALPYQLDSFNAATLVTGGGTVNPSSLMVTTQPTSGTVTVEGTQLLYLPVQPNPTSYTVGTTTTWLSPVSTTGNQTVTFQICQSAPTVLCTTGTVTYVPAESGYFVGNQLSAAGIPVSVVEDTGSGIVAPASAAAGSTFTTVTAAPMTALPVTNSNFTVAGIGGYRSITPVPTGVTLVPGSLSVSGGDSATSGNFTATLCTAAMGYVAGTCTANQSGGDFNTPYPYIETSLNAADAVAGGSELTLPTVTASWTVTASSGSTISDYETEFVVVTNVDTIGILDLDAYPSNLASDVNQGEDAPVPTYSTPPARWSVNVTSGVTGTAPTITSASSTTFNTGAAGSFTVTATGSPTPTIAESGALPSGVTYSDGVLSGTPTVTGTFPITFTASNGVSPNAVQDFTLDSVIGIGGGFLSGAADASYTDGPSFTAGESFDSGQPIDVVVPPNTVFSPGTAIHIFECAAPDGAKPVSTVACDGNTDYQGGTLFVQSNGSVDAIADSALHSPYTVYALPDFVTFGETSGNSCGLGSANDCVLYIGEGGGGDTGFTQPHFFSQVFQVHSDPADSGTLDPGDGTFPADAAPAITSGASTTFTSGTAGTFTVTATGYPAPTFSETGALPSGVTLNSSTGVLSGTPATGSGGSYPITITASNGVSPDATQDFTLTVGQAPAITSASSTTFTIGSAGTFTVTATGTPAPTFSETGALPSGVTLNSTTGVLSGTPIIGSGGSYPITITASNGITPNATQSFTLTVATAASPPAITSAAATTFTVGTAGTFTVTATGSPAPTFSETGTLPSGVTLNDTTGVLSGTPAAGSGGSYPIVITAANGNSPNATQDFTLTVDQAPAITSAGSTSFTVGTAGTFTVTATGNPAPTFSETGTLPSGVTLNATTGVLSGTPAAGTGGLYNITISAANGVGTAATQSFALTVTDVPTAPIITSADADTFTAGTSGTFSVTATGYPIPTYTETGTLPSGVTLGSTGVLSGTPAAGTGGSYPITITATNGVSPDATQDFTLTVNQAPAVTSAASTTFTAGTAGTFTVTASGYPAPTFSESGALPGGVTLNSTTGVLSGTPAAGSGGSYPLTITASNGTSPNGTQSFTLTVDQAPAITSAASTTFKVGTSGTFTVTATGKPAPTFSETGSLPGGVTLNTTTGVLAGTPAAASGGSYPITITASNGVGTAATQDFTLTVDQAPAVTSAASTTFTVGSAGTFTVAGSGYPAPTFGETGTLPSGVTLNDTTGVLSGTPAAGSGGSYPLTITASNGVTPNGTQSFTLTVDQAPAITSADAATFTVGSAGTFHVVATGNPAPTFSEIGTLPSGVTLSSAGVLAGTPAAGTSGSYPITVTASNGVGTAATQDFTLTVNQAPAITSADNTTFTNGVAGTFTVTATGSPAPALAESGALPTGVTFDAATGVLSGTTSETGVFTITFTASNGVGTAATQTFTLTVPGPPAAPTVDTVTPGNASATVTWTPGSDGGSPILSYTVAASPGTQTCTVNAPATSCTVDGLTNGTAYTFVVTATNGLGSGSGSTPSSPATPTANGAIPGYWQTTSAGGVLTRGSAMNYGSPAALHLSAPIVGLVPTPDRHGYWLVGADGGVFSYGDAKFHGSAGDLHLNAPIVGMAATSDGKGYWLVAADGGVFTYGDARFAGSAGNEHLNAPIVGIAGNGTTGYWLVASDGGVFAYGSAHFHGSAGNVQLNAPIVGIAATANGSGYYLAAADGGVFSYGSIRFYGADPGGINGTVVGITLGTNGGYSMGSSTGAVYSFGPTGYYGNQQSTATSAPFIGIAS
ncbi:MAG: putative Ig domain-containing protein [Acidimicrobiales bacterium]